MPPSPTAGVKMRGFLALAGFVLLTLAVAWVGSLFTRPAIPGWYAGLEKPWFTPPGWVFGPVWTVLYILMAVAAWRVWLAPASAARRSALWWFFVQLALNAVWSPAFFGLQAPLLGLVVIVLLLAALTVTVVRFFAVDSAAGWLMAPYLAWVAYAALLNAAIVVLN
jgi:translocator protein